MFKVKKEVDLKTLENFGYKLHDFNYLTNKPFTFSLYIKDCGYDELNGVGYGVNIKERDVEIRKCYSCGYEILDDIKGEKFVADLIQAGIVEKVVNK